MKFTTVLQLEFKSVSCAYPLEKLQNFQIQNKNSLRPVIKSYFFPFPVKRLRDRLSGKNEEQLPLYYPSAKPLKLSISLQGNRI